MKRSWIAAVLIASASCMSGRIHFHDMSRPPALAGEWIDTRHATPQDTSLWVLRTDGYDGSAHLIHHGADRERTESRYGAWYLHGSLTGEADRSICFAKRIGRDAATCLPFTLDTIELPGGPWRRLVVHGYQGQHTTGDRILIAPLP